MKKDDLSIYDKLFVLYNLTMKIEKEELAESQFNDISINDLHIIHIISLKEDITISQIAKLMGVSKPALTGNVDKLEKLDYIRRVPNKKDRRVTNIELTQRGKLLQRLHNKAHVNFIDTLLKDCSDSDIKRLNSSLDRLIGQLKTGDKN